MCGSDSVGRYVLSNAFVSLGIACARALMTAIVSYSRPSWYVGVAFLQKDESVLFRFIAGMTIFQLCTLVALNPMMMIVVVAVSAADYVSLFSSRSKYDQNVF